MGIIMDLDVEIFTYNQTQTLILDQNGEEITTDYGVYYGEDHSLTCYSQFGRPGPQFT